MPQRELAVHQRRRPPLVGFEVQPGNVSAFGDTVGAGDGPRVAVTDARRLHRLEILRGDEVRDEDTVDGIAALGILTGVADLDEVLDPVRRILYRGASPE